MYTDKGAKKMDEIKELWKRKRGRNTFYFTLYYNVYYVCINKHWYCGHSCVVYFLLFDFTKKNNEMLKRKNK